MPDGAVRFDSSAHGYRVSADGCYRVVEQLKDGAAERVMLFHDIPALPVDLAPLNFHVSQRPGSFFQAFLNLNLRLPDGSVSVFGRAFHHYTAAARVEREVRDLDDLREILPTYFGIPADDPPMRELDEKK